VGIRIPCGPEEDEEESGRRKAPQTDFTAGSFCRELVRRLRKPLVSTSANISGEPAPVGFDDIAEEIRSAVDFVVPRRFGQGAFGRASQIIKVGLGGEVEIIRA
jgi:L-threonylcarbamoyladenylate synthase